jgi:hypothetical protein
MAIPLEKVGMIRNRRESTYDGAHSPWLLPLVQTGVGTGERGLNWTLCRMTMFRQACDCSGTGIFISVVADRYNFANPMREPRYNRRLSPYIDLGTKEVESMIKK